MPALRFLHTADLHLGKSFGGYPAADRLRVARLAVLQSIATLARERDVPHVLVAGDLFDTPNPRADTWRQAVAVMAETPSVTWWLLPGNHDNFGQGRATWEGIAALGHGNVKVLHEAAPVELQPGAVLLPAPLLTRRPASDPTAWMDAAGTPADAIRVGLAHGPIQGFGEGELPPDIIAPDRDRRARLDWLALGDWHGAMRVSERVAYAGAPERTDFRHDGRGSCLLVEIDEPGATPRVETIPLGHFDWRRLTLDLVPGDDPEAMVAEAVDGETRREMLVQVLARGRLPLRDATVLAAMEQDGGIGPDFCHFEMRMAELATDVEAADLDAISTNGALRQAADALAIEADDGALSAVQRAVAAAALRRLHGLVAGEDQ